MFLYQILLNNNYISLNKNLQLLNKILFFFNFFTTAVYSIFIKNQSLTEHSLSSISFFSTNLPTTTVISKSKYKITATIH
jgi:hypothetical protein